MRLLLFPFAVLYDFVTAIRNWMFDIGWKKSMSFELPIICVGNLKVGGTGKTPHTEYIVRLLKDHLKVTILSRGYGRRTKGYRMASSGDTADTIGDEPFQYFYKWNNEVQVVVSEKRVEGTQQLLKSHTPDVIILDDAFQHRYIKAGLYILLTEYGAPFFDDFLLPMGNLREARRGATRAQIVIVTKCPRNLSHEIQKTTALRIKQYAPNAEVYFSFIKYGELVSLHHDDRRYKGQPIVLITGIADGKRLYLDMIEHGFNVVEFHPYADHKNYSLNHVASILELLSKHKACLVTTEKDAGKLYNLIPKEVASFYIPIEIDFLSIKSQFDESIFQFCRK